MYALFFNCWTVSDTFYWWIGYWQEKEIKWSEKIWSDLSWYESHVFCDMFRWMKTKPRQSSECWWNAFVTSYTPNHSNRRRNKNRKLYRLKKLQGHKVRIGLSSKWSSISAWQTFACLRFYRAAFISVSLMNSDSKLVVWPCHFDDITINWYSHSKVSLPMFKAIKNDERKKNSFEHLVFRCQSFYQVHLIQ